MSEEWSRTNKIRWVGEGVCGRTMRINKVGNEGTLRKLSFVPYQFDFVVWKMFWIILVYHTTFCTYILYSAEERNNVDKALLIIIDFAL